jgi:transposase
MKKRSYGSVNVKKVNVEKLAESVRGERIVLGVDVAKERMYGSVMVARGEEVELNIGWTDPVETRELVELVMGLPAAKLEVVMEPSGTYGDPLRWLFLERGVEVYRVSPKRSHDAAEVYDGVASWHDVKSAGLIAKLHLHGASEAWPFRSDEERELAAALRTMVMYDRQESSNLNRLEAQLARHWPELTEDMDLTSATLLELVKEYGSPDAVRDDEEGARSLMRRAGGRFLREDKVVRVLEGAASSTGVPMTDGEREAIKELAAEIHRCRAKGRAARARVKALAQDQVSTSRMAKLVGTTTSAVLVSGVGDPARYTSASAFLKGLGLNLKEKSSGKHQGKLKISKRGPGDCRYYLYLAALRLIGQDTVVGRWYERKVARDGGKAKNKAVVAVMRKLAEALWHVGRGAVFDSRRLFDVRRLGFEASPETKRPPTSRRRTSGLKHASEALQETGLI